MPAQVSRNRASFRLSLLLRQVLCGLVVTGCAALAALDAPGSPGVLAAPAAPAAPADDANELFETRIRPVLVQQCMECHNSRGTAEGGLSLDDRAGLRAGGDGGAVIVPGDPDNSRLIAILRHDVPGLEMPSGAPQLEDRVIRDFEEWIRQGAVDPRDHPPSADELAAATAWETIFEERRQWWSFQPVPESVPVPDTATESDHPIDHFIAAPLQEHGLSPAPAAADAVLIRRLFVVLIGLPPSPDELTRWTHEFAAAGAGGRDAVIAQLIDALLASPHFGERWARHWMDWIRYAESHGSEGDPRIPDAWRYRDYLIRALNDDVPVSQLLREHVAGDLLQSPRRNPELGINESAIGPAHWRMVFHGFAPTDALDERVRFVDDQINVFSKAFLGLTVSCARCHDHKFDAISQADYYALFGVLNSCRPARTVIDLPERSEPLRNRLRELKGLIRAALAERWEQQLSAAASSGEAIGAAANDAATASVTAETPADVASAAGEPASGTVAPPAGRLDLQDWFFEGAGVADGPQLAGDFTVTRDGDRAINAVLPAGVFSHRLSTRSPARVTSPDLQLDREYDLWLHVIGDQGASVRYVVQNYPRSGTVYPVQALKPEWQWVRFDLSYWVGDTIHVELCAARDAPLLVRDQDRSWFGIREARLLPAGSPAPNSAESRAASGPHSGWSNVPDSPSPHGAALPPALRSALAEAVSAWSRAEMSDRQARLLQEALRRGVLDDTVAPATDVGGWLREYRTAESGLPVPLRVPGLDETIGRDQPLYVRGDHRQPGEPIPRRFLEVVDPQPYESAASGRRRLAEDLLRDDNPLTRRVIVNRIWHHVFGRGIVATPDNFGRMGKRPSHPQLLDWLAIRFVEDGWSLKSLIRLMLTSRTWQQSSTASAAAQAEDPDNQWLSHAFVRRLDAEAIRDHLLAVSGDLQRDLFGPPVPGTSARRSVYVRVIRNQLDPFLRTFDFPEPFSATGRRSVTNVPAQSLTLLNDPQVGQRARSWADRLLSDRRFESDDARIAHMYRAAFARDAAATDIAAAKAFLQDARTTRQAAADRQAELARRGDTLRSERAALLARARRLLADASETQAEPRQPHPDLLARWTFDGTTDDSVGELDAELHGGARVEDGALVVDGRSAWAGTPPLPVDLRAKTLEAWVQLDTLDQRGGGVMTVQTTNGAVFDAIVFGEQTPRHWLPGSDHFRRTEDLQGTPEDQAGERPVHVAITWDEDGVIRAYRNGEPYGRAYTSRGPQTFAAGESAVAFGLRHLPAGGNRLLAGRIVEARLYRSALTEDDIRQSAAGLTDFVTQAELAAALVPEERQRLAALGSEIQAIDQQLSELQTSTSDPPERAAWNDLARSLFCFKEFLYIR